MLIKYLIIEDKKQVIRRIDFKLGVNLIVDVTSSSKQKESGNNVGKTTVLRLVDYCLGADAKAIYEDPEFKTINSTVQTFLVEQGVTIQLCLGKSFDNSSGDLVLRRNFLKGEEKISEINGEKFLNNKEYCKRLGQILFGLTSSKPTFRQLIPKFIRTDSSKMDKVIKYLHFTTTDIIYEAIYLFLFCRSDVAALSAEKNVLTRKIDFNKKIINNTFSSKTAATIRQHLGINLLDIERLESHKNDFKVNDQYEKDFLELQNIKVSINNIFSVISKKQFKLKLLVDSINELKQQHSDIDLESLREIYKEAKLYISSLQKSFDELLIFHNQLIANKLRFLSEDIPKLEMEIQQLKEEQEKLFSSEEKIGKRLLATGSLANYELLVSEINRKYEQKGRLEEELEKLGNIESSIKKWNDRILEINNSINAQADILEKNIAEFNKLFSAYSEIFYDEKFVLSPDFDQEKKIYKFNISNVDGAMGDGKKKGLIAAFDLGYISYANEKNILSPQFVMHDRIEGVHGNQLKSLFDIVNDINFNGQYIVSILSGKFSELQLADHYLEENKILELSQTDKLFKIEA